MRKTYLALLQRVVRCGVTGLYHRGEPEVFVWLQARGLIVSRNTALGAFIATDAGRKQLYAFGICDQCGGWGTYQVPDRPRDGGWAPCDCLARRATLDGVCFG
jgi:hypothetical protein